MHDTCFIETGISKRPRKKKVNALYNMSLSHGTHCQGYLSSKLVAESMKDTTERQRDEGRKRGGKRGDSIKGMCDK